MRVIITTICITIAFMSCKSTDSLTKAEEIANITEKVESGNFTFIPQTALPMSGKNINVDPSFRLKINKDTVDSYLPYFGRAYTAPFPTESGGVTFVSTDFDYELSEKKKDMWDASIKINDYQRKYKLMLKIGDTGYTTLTVQDDSRQPISFYGKVQ